jgi:anti-anti-sigma regulatory factor
VEQSGAQDGATGRVEARPLDGRTALVAVRGTADRMAALDVQRAILGEIASGRTHAIVDLSGVGEVRPGVLGVLLTIRRRLLTLGGALTIISPVPAGTLFGVAGADEILPRLAAVPPAQELK